MTRTARGGSLVPTDIAHRPLSEASMGGSQPQQACGQEIVCSGLAAWPIPTPRGIPPPSRDLDDGIPFLAGKGDRISARASVIADQARRGTAGPSYPGNDPVPAGGGPNRFAPGVPELAKKTIKTIQPMMGINQISHHHPERSVS